MFVNVETTTDQIVSSSSLSVPIITSTLVEETTESFSTITFEQPTFLTTIKEEETTEKISTFSVPEVTENTNKISISTPVVTPSDISSTFSIPEVTTSDNLEISTPSILTTLIPTKYSTIPLPTFLTTTKDKITIPTLSTLIFTKISPISLTYPILTTTEEMSTSNLPLTTPEFSTMSTLLPPVVTTTEEIITEPQTSSKFTSTYTLPPPTIFTTSDYTKFPIATSTDPILTNSQFSTKQSTYFTLLPTTITENTQSITTENHETSTHPIDTSITIQSTSIPAIETSQIPGTTCPPFPDICSDNNNPNFGDNNIDPRLRPKRQFINGCPCIDIRSALRLLLQRGMLSNIKHELLEELKVEEFEAIDDVEIIPITHPKNRLAWN